MISRRSFITATGACLAVPITLGAASKSWGQTRNIRVRKNLMTLSDSDPFFGQYAEAVKAMHRLPPADPRNWFAQATIHANFCQHGTLNFVSWHRPYLAMFEEICGALIGDSSFALHYWDWSQKEGIIPDPFYDNPFLNVTYWKDPGQYTGKSWGPVNSLPIRALSKGTGLQSNSASGGPFTASTLQTILRQSAFGNFTNMLERQPHNTGHVLAGFPPSGLPGHIGDGLSPLDPIFWMHHAMVDHMWAKWQSAGNVTEDNDQVYSGMFVDRDGKSETFTSKQVRDFVALGYTYDDLVGAERFGMMLENVEPSSHFQATLAEELRRARPVSVAKSSATFVAGIGKPASASLSTGDLLRYLRGTRVFRANIAGQKIFATEGTRVVAILRNVSWPDTLSGGLLVNVFVNCPYLSEQIPSSDQNYAGTFGFFGSRKMSEMSGESSVVVDITAPLTSQADAGRLNDRLTVQLMPLHAGPHGSGSETFTVGGIEIFTT